MIVTPRRVYNQTLKKYRKAITLGMMPRTVVQKLSRLNDKDKNDSYNKEWIVNHNYRFLYCPIHKVASTSMAQAILLLSDSNHKEFLMRGSDALLRTYVSTHYQLSNYSRQQAESFINDKDYFKFAFVRNPWSRLVSAYLDKFVTNRAISIKTTKTFESSTYSKLGEPINHQKSITFRQFLYCLTEAEPSKMNPHWKPQHLFLSDVEFDFVGKMESLADDFETIISRLGISSDFELPYSKTRKAKYKQISDHIPTESYADYYPKEIKSLGSYPHYRLFYSKELIEWVHQKYKKDIEYFQYEF